MVSAKKDQPLTRWRNELEGVFDQFLSRLPAPFDPSYGLDRFWGLDVDERDTEVVVRAELPGFELEEIDVQLQDQVLCIKAEKPATRSLHAPFHRRIVLPGTIQPDGVEARYRNGVLEVRVPKKDEAKPKHIAVR